MKPFGTLGARWLKFNAAGLIGVGIQLAALALFAKVLRWHYVIATAAAVEVAVLHNFAWHEVWTWRDRRQEAGSRVSRCLRFHLGNGLVSILANLVFMRRFAGYKVTRLHDVPPKLEVLLLDRRNEPSAGAGETPIIAVAPAMANAMHDATGKRVRSLPLRTGAPA